MATQQQPATSQQYQQGQVALASLALPLLNRAWLLFDPAHLDESVQRFWDAVQSVVDYYGKAAAAAALQRFKEQRVAAGVAGRAPSVPLPQLPDAFVQQLVADAGSIALGGDQQAASDYLDSGVQQLIQESARRATMGAAELDREARGWVRVPNEDACSFCMMLALRGPVYKSDTVKFRAHHKQPNGSGGDCKCTAEPVFGHWEPTAKVRAAQKLWDEHVSDAGRSGHDARTAFRQAYEGRDVTGAKGAKRSRKVADMAPGDQETFYRNQIRILDAMQPKNPDQVKYRDEQLKRYRGLLGQ